MVKTHHIQTISIGVAVSLVVGLLTYVLTLSFLQWEDSAGKMVSAGIVLIVVAYIGLFGLFKVPIAHRGVPLFFGRRISTWLLDEGWNWIPPKPFMNFETVDVREMTIDIPDSLVISGNKEDGEEKNRAGMFIDTSMQASVDASNFNGPYAFLSIGEKVVRLGLIHLVVKTLRDVATRSDDEALMGMHEELAEAIKDALTSIPDGEIESIAHRWGIVVHNVFVTRIVPSNPDLLRAYEQRSIEQRQQISEVIEREHVIDSVKRIAEELKISTSEAAIIFAAERDKMHGRQQIIVTGDEGSPVMKAASMMVSATEKVTDSLANRLSSEGGK